MTSRSERERHIREAGWNALILRSGDLYIHCANGATMGGKSDGQVMTGLNGGVMTDVHNSVDNVHNYDRPLITQPDRA